MNMPDSIVIFGVVLYCDYKTSSIKDEHYYYNSANMNIEIDIAFDQIHVMSHKIAFSIHGLKFSEKDIEKFIEEKIISAIDLPLVFYENLIKRMKADILK